MDLFILHGVREVVIMGDAPGDESSWGWMLAQHRSYRTRGPVSPTSWREASRGSRKAHGSGQEPHLPSHKAGSADVFNRCILMVFIARHGLGG